jgi:hypothetical protein
VVVLLLLPKPILLTPGGLIYDWDTADFNPSPIMLLDYGLFGGPPATNPPKFKDYGVKSDFSCLFLELKGVIVAGD